ncbi:MAG: hypothetical protein P8X64_00890 [Anaerolineales bacterium]
MKASRGCLTTIQKLLALVLAAAFVITLPPALFGRDLARVIFRPEVFSATLRARLLDSGLISERIREAFNSDQWLGTLGDDGRTLQPAFEHLSRVEREEILNQLLPDGWMQEQFDQVIREFFLWIDMDRDQADVAVNLKPVKDHLRSGGIDSIVEILVDSWPSCTAEGETRLERELLSGPGVPSEYCEPSEPMRSELTFLATSSLIEQVEQVPDRLPLFENVDSAQAGRLKDDLRSLRALALWGWFVPASMLGLVMAVTVRSIHDVRRWWGLPLIMSGVAAFMLTIVLNSVRGSLASDLVAGLGEGGSMLQSALVFGLEGVISLALRSLLFQSILLAVIGLGLWFGLKRLASRSDGAKEAAASSTSGVPEKQAETAPPPVSRLDQEREQGDPPSGIFG